MSLNSTGVLEQGLSENAEVWLTALKKSNRAPVAIPPKEQTPAAPRCPHRGQTWTMPVHPERGQGEMLLHKAPWAPRYLPVQKQLEENENTT